MPRAHHAKAHRGEFCEVIFPNPRKRYWSGPPVHLQHRLICCDCGLAHDFEFIVVQVRRGRDGKMRMTRMAPASYTVQFRARRNERSSARVRQQPHDFVRAKKRPSS